MVVEYGEFQEAMSEVELQFERSDADMWSLVQLTASSFRSYGACSSKPLQRIIERLISKKKQPLRWR
jgi:hypothetical protein